jgi:hypothetical protein
MDTREQRCPVCHRKAQARRQDGAVLAALVMLPHPSGSQECSGTGRIVLLKGQRSIWWHLAMEFHQEPSVGHSPTKAADCYECRRIAAMIERFLA